MNLVNIQCKTVNVIKLKRLSEKIQKNIQDLSKKILQKWENSRLPLICLEIKVFCGLRLEMLTQTCDYREDTVKPNLTSTINFMKTKSRNFYVSFSLSFQFSAMSFQCFYFVSLDWAIPRQIRVVARVFSLFFGMREIRERTMLSLVELNFEVSFFSFFLKTSCLTFLNQFLFALNFFKIFGIHLKILLE